MTILFVAIMILPMILAGVFGVWPLFWVFVTFNCIFGAIELISKKVTGSSVSQYFWKFSAKNKGKALIIIGSMIAMWAALILHLTKILF